tara:strand:+ start:82 stop:516 length:435 start_codon:yes stop_codon:yes gene_type:complete
MSNDVYTDGACSGNPGIGGWGIVILKNEGDQPIYLNGGSFNTTNNQMELKATIEALKFFEKSSNINLFTDSKYVKNGIEVWINNWKKNGWKTSSKKNVKNKDYWIELDSLVSKHRINWIWIKGHSGNKYNEMADLLARKFITNT